MKRRYSISKALSTRNETCNKEVQLTAMEIDNGQSRRWRLDTATQIRKIRNHIPTEQNKARQLQKKDEPQEMCNSQGQPTKA